MEFVLNSKMRFICSNIYPKICNVTLFILSGNCSTCFGWCLHPSSGAQTTVSTASVIYHTVTATCRNSVLTNKNILKYIQQDATLHSLFYLETALHVSGGTSTHHQERKQLYLQHLVFVRPLLLLAAIARASNPSIPSSQ
jgi:hypothetical protein